MASTVVTGQVSKVFYDGRGAELVESFTVKGSPVTKRWTAWFAEPHGMSEGDEATVSGLHSDELNEWADKETGETKRSVKRSLNNAKILPSRDSVENAGRSSARAEPVDDSSVPF